MSTTFNPTTAMSTTFNPTTAMSTTFNPTTAMSTTAISTTAMNTTPMSTTSIPTIYYQPFTGINSGPYLTDPSLVYINFIQSINLILKNFNRGYVNHLLFLENSSITNPNNDFFKFLYSNALLNFNNHSTDTNWINPSPIIKFPIISFKPLSNFTVQPVLNATYSTNNSPIDVFQDTIYVMLNPTNFTIKQNPYIITFSLGYPTTHLSKLKIFAQNDTTSNKDFFIKLYNLAVILVNHPFYVWPTGYTKALTI